MQSFRNEKSGLLKAGVLAFLAFTSLSIGSASGAEVQTLSPQMTIRVTVVQWNATSGAYEKWDALGGDYQISDDRTVYLPVIGAVSVDNVDTTKLSAEIASRIQAKIGLVQPPETTVGIVAYPPIYVVGDVKSPGKYEYDRGLTVLRSLALSGGEYREEKQGGSKSAEFASELRGLDDSILRTEIRIARLQAEMSNAKELTYTIESGPNSEVAKSILQQENAIFTARANHISRQTKSFDELREFFSREMSNLETKTKGSEADIASLEEELRKMKPLVEKGLIVPATRNELERTIRSVTGDRLDLATAIMRARQGIAEASRSIESLHDTQLTEVASDLQSEQSVLYQLKVKRQYAQQRLLDSLAGETSSADPGSLSFAVSRQVDGKTVELAATEDTPLQPGDVVRVRKSVHKLADTGETTSSIVTGQAGQ